MRSLRRLGVTVAMMLAASIAHAAAGDGEDPLEVLCVPPVLAQQPTEARCSLDIWGYVVDVVGVPVEGVQISDGAKVTSTDSRGFYDLFEWQFGGYTISASKIGCVGPPPPSVQVSPLTLVEGGERVDLTIDC